MFRVQCRVGITTVILTYSYKEQRFSTLFGKINPLTYRLLWTGQNGFARFFVFVKIFAKTVCRRGRFVGLSLNLKEQSEKIKYLGVFASIYPIATF